MGPVTTRALGLPGMMQHAVKPQPRALSVPDFDVHHIQPLPGHKRGLGRERGGARRTGLGAMDFGPWGGITWVRPERGHQEVCLGSALRGQQTSAEVSKHEAWGSVASLCSPAASRELCSVAFVREFIRGPMSRGGSRLLTPLRLLLLPRPPQVGGLATGRFRAHRSGLEPGARGLL
jgi:hypothetical protein